MDVHKPESVMRIRTAADLGGLVRDRRQAAGLSQAELASRAGVSRRWLAALESGKATAAFALILRTLDALDLAISVAPAPPADRGVDLDELLDAFDEDAG